MSYLMEFFNLLDLPFVFWSSQTIESNCIELRIEAAISYAEYQKSTLLDDGTTGHFLYGLTDCFSVLR